MMEYKGYEAQVEYDSDDRAFHGLVVNIADTIHFEGATVDELEQAFRDSVDDYLAFCAERDEEPDKPYSGKFVVRIDPELHRRLAAAAREKGTSLNRYVTQCLSRGLQTRTRSKAARK